MTPSPREYLRSSADRCPDRSALHFGSVALTYAQLADQVDALTDDLQREGIGQGNVVALALGNGLGFVIWYWALLQAKATVLALPGGSPEGEQAALFDAAGVHWLVASEQTHRENASQAIHHPATSTALYRLDGRSVGSGLSAEALFLRRSSGSTGAPKLVVKSERDIDLNTRAFCDYLRLDEHDRFLGCAPFFHGYGALNLLATAYLGAFVSVLPRFMPGPVIETAHRQRPTIFLATPPMLHALAVCPLNSEPRDRRAFDSLRYCLSAGSPLTTRIHDAFNARYDISAASQYGTVESGTVAIDVDVNPAEGNATPGEFYEGRVGRALGHVRFEILDEHGERCPPGQRGAVTIEWLDGAGPALDDRTGVPPAPRRSVTGDEGFLDESGRLHLCGRHDIINIGGDKVDALEVRQMLLRLFPDVTDVLVAGVTDRHRTVVKAWLETPNDEIDRAAVSAACRDHLSAFKIPSLVTTLRRFPRDEHGKVSRSALLALTAGTPGG